MSVRAVHTTPALHIFLIFLRLGLTSFGGPIAHIGFFREEFVARRQWLSDAAYSELVALCQFLPGPASSQVGIALGLHRGGLSGAIAAWFGFTLPSALALTLFGMALLGMGTTDASGWIHGLKVVAVAIVAQALWAMSRSLCPDRMRATLAIIAALIATLLPGLSGQILVIVGGGLIGWRLLSPAHGRDGGALHIPISRASALISLTLFFILLALLPLLAHQSDNYTLQLFDGLYRAGALVFGGGHVVLPLLQSATVTPGWLSNDLFLAGYGAAQAVPGPLFTFAAYLGAVSSEQPNGVIGALVATVAIFLPSFLLVIGTLPLWQRLRRHSGIQRALPGINAAVVGLLLAALYNPVITSGILGLTDLILALICLAMLSYWKLPVWLVVVGAAMAGHWLL